MGRQLLGISEPPDPLAIWRAARSAYLREAGPVAVVIDLEAGSLYLDHRAFRDLGEARGGREGDSGSGEFSEG
jgi:hypothetical protein